jgi:hypothetical protein
MSSKNYVQSGYRHNLDLLVILHKLHVYDPTRSRSREESGLSRPAYVNAQGEIRDNIL